MAAGRRLWLLMAFSVLLGGLLYYFLSGWPFYLDPEMEIDPGRPYTLKFWDYPLPLVWKDGTTYLEFVQGVIEDFQREYPNVQIIYHPLGFATGPGELSQALASGRPPDIYSEPFPTQMVHHQGLQVPVTHYMPPEDKAFYHPLVLALQEAKDDIWAWPAWVSPQVWIGNRQLLREGGLDVEQVQTLGWNWEDYMALAQGFEGKNHGGFVFSTGSCLELFSNLLANNGLVGEKDDDFPLKLEETATLFQTLHAEGLWRDATEKWPWVKEFWEGKIALLGPVNGWVIRGSGVGARRSRHCPELVFLPPPHRLGAREYIKPIVARVCVFRQRRYRGADNVKVAMEFARYFSHRQGQGLAPQLWALPAFNSRSLLDKENNELSLANIQFLLRAQNYLLPTIIAQNQWEREDWKKEVLAPRLQKLLKGEINPREFATLIEEELKNES
ncbi:MAG: extracellular solute-binding protein [Firmicutes bacterium]|nr:extracellular solute-binding protein [Bacillota bacterium]